MWLVSVLCNWLASSRRDKAEMVRLEPEPLLLSSGPPLVGFFFANIFFVTI